MDLTRDDRPGWIRVVPPPSPQIMAAREEVRLALPTPVRRMLELLGFENFLACMTVLQSERAAGRILVPHAKLSPTLAALHAVGLSYRVAPYEHVAAALPPPAAYHEGQFVNLSGPKRGRAVLYVGISDEFAKGALLAEAAGQHELTGKLFGYPDCCSRFFVASTNGAEDRTASSIQGLGPYPRDLNPVAPLLHGFPLLFHFPCSPMCALSLQLVRQRSSCLENLAASFHRLRALGAGIALYGSNLGVCLITRYRKITNRQFLIREITTLEPERVSFLRAQHDIVITLHSPHRWQVGDILYDEAQSFAAVFA